MLRESDGRRVHRSIYIKPSSSMRRCRQSTGKRLCFSMPRFLSNGMITNLILRESYGRRVYRSINIQLRRRKSAAGQVLTHRIFFRCAMRDMSWAACPDTGFEWIWLNKYIHLDRGIYIYIYREIYTQKHTKVLAYGKVEANAYETKTWNGLGRVATNERVGVMADTKLLERNKGSKYHSP